MQGSVTHHIAVTHMARDIVIAGDTVKNRGFIVVNRIFPLIQNRRIILRIQIRNMHPGEIRKGMVKVIEGIVENHLAAVWDKIAEPVLKVKLILTHPGRAINIRRGRRISVCAGIVCGSKHSVIEKPEAGGK